MRFVLLERLLRLVNNVLDSKQHFLLVIIIFIRQYAECDLTLLYVEIESVQRLSIILVRFGDFTVIPSHCHHSTITFINKLLSLAAYIALFGVRSPFKVYSLNQMLGLPNPQCRDLFLKLFKLFLLQQDISLSLESLAAPHHRLTIEWHSYRSR